MNVSEIKDAILPAVVARKCFIVDVIVSSGNDIVLTIESEEGTVVLDDCVELSRTFEGLFDREKEDYSLTVTSAGLDQPFKVLRQYRKAIGTEVEASLKGGRRFRALLVDADEDSLTLEHKVVRKAEGSKKKETVTVTETFPMDQVNSVRPHIEF
ncbi:MAG: ribosome assembly cofactor RimP [Candidatus Cryptobacteroides sp.]